MKAAQTQMSLTAAHVMDLEDSFARVNGSVRKVLAGETESKRIALEEIFAMNNVMGRIAMTGKRTKAALREVQLNVNLTTIGVKKGNQLQMEEGLRMTSESLLKLKRRFL